MSLSNPPISGYTIQTISQAGQNLYLNELFADIHFIIESKLVDRQYESIPAHKNLLGVTSDVFRVMFNGSWDENEKVKIVDASPDAFKEFLQFFYLTEVYLTMGNVAAVMNLCKKYNVAEGFKRCGTFMRQNLSIDDICWAYELAVHLDHDEVKIFCETMIRLNTMSVFQSEGFLKTDQKILRRILKVDSLKCTISELFYALLNWIKAEMCTNTLTKDIVRGQFNDLFTEIRFEQMAILEFFPISMQYRHWFTDLEYTHIFNCIRSSVTSN